MSSFLVWWQHRMKASCIVQSFTNAGQKHLKTRVAPWFTNSARCLHLSTFLLLKLFCSTWTRRRLPMSTSHFCLKSDPFANTVWHLLRVARPAVMFSIGGSASIRVKPRMVSECKAMCYRKLANCSGRVTAMGDIHVAGKVLSVVFPRRSGQW